MEGQATPTLGQPSEPCSPRATSEGPAPRHGRGHQLTEAVAISQTLCLRCACCHHQQVPQELEGGAQESAASVCVFPLVSQGPPWTHLSVLGTHTADPGDGALGDHQEVDGGLRGHVAENQALPGGAGQGEPRTHGCSPPAVPCALLSPLPCHLHRGWWQARCGR